MKRSTFTSRSPLPAVLVLLATACGPAFAAPEADPALTIACRLDPARIAPAAATQDGDAIASYDARIDAWLAGPAAPRLACEVVDAAARTPRRLTPAPPPAGDRERRALAAT